MHLLLNKSRSIFRRHPIVFISFLLISITLSVYSQVLQYDFINYDDPLYITENTNIQEGFTLESITWALTSFHASNWHPLTWLSHMTDVQIFGLNPAGHHSINIILHIFNVLLIFHILRRMTNSFWRSAVVSALFAVHPLHVESVAWVAERKDVLSSLFFFITLWSYVGYVEDPKPRRYLLTILTFSLSLMAKPMVVTLPFLLLLLDYWPLGRISFRNHQYGLWAKEAWKLVWEKIPFFILAGVCSLITFLAHKQGGSFLAMSDISLRIRTENALLSYVRYIGKMFWPQDLAVFYPHPGNTISAIQVAGAALFLVSISALTVMGSRPRPYLIIGWLWYIGMLAPVIGLLQVGAHAIADRYTYLPLIGLFIIITWGVPDLLRRWSLKNGFLVILTGGVILILTLLTWHQVQYWENSRTLFEHSLQVTEDNYIAHTNLGAFLGKGEQKEAAISHYMEAIRIKPDYWLPYYNLGLISAQQEKFDSAISHFSKVLNLRPNHADAHVSLGLIFTKQGKLAMGLAQFYEVLKIRPDDTEVLYNSAVVLSKQGRRQAAISRYRRLLEIEPGHPGAHNNLGNIYISQGDVEKAIGEFQLELQYHPNDAKAHNNLGNSYNEAGNIEKAVKEYKIALGLEPNYLKAHLNLGNAYVFKGDLEKAASEYTTATRLAPGFLEAHHNLATVNTQLGRLEEARRSYKKILEINPNDEAAQKALFSLTR